jgi:MFS family permease
MCMAWEMPYIYTLARVEHYHGVNYTLPDGNLTQCGGSHTDACMDTSLLVIGMGAGSIVSRIAMSLFADRFSNYRFGIFVAVSVLLGGVSIAFPISTSQEWMYVYSFLFGFLVGQ